MEPLDLVERPRAMSERLYTRFGRDWRNWPAFDSFATAPMETGDAVEEPGVAAQV